jgi:hypothetical protein
LSSTAAEGKEEDWRRTNQHGRKKLSQNRRGKKLQISKEKTRTSKDNNHKKGKQNSKKGKPKP